MTNALFVDLATPGSLSQRRLTGIMLVLTAALIMLPWLALCATAAGITITLRTLIALPVAIRESIDHAGDYAHGL